MVSAAFLFSQVIFAPGSSPLRKGPQLGASSKGRQLTESHEDGVIWSSSAISIPCEINCDELPGQLKAHDSGNLSDQFPTVALKGGRKLVGGAMYLSQVKEKNRMVALIKEKLPEPSTAKKIIDTVKEAVNTVNVDGVVVLFGSAVTGLYRKPSSNQEGSDLDFTIIKHWGQNYYKNDDPEVEEVLNKIREVLKTKGWTVKEGVDRGNLISMGLPEGEEHQWSGVDITFNSLIPIYNSLLVKEYLDISPSLGKLIVDVRNWADENFLKLPSFAWTLMCIFFLQSSKYEFPSLQAKAGEDKMIKQKNTSYEHNVSFFSHNGSIKIPIPENLFDDFFKFYGQHLIDNKVISIRHDLKNPGSGDEEKYKFQPLYSAGKQIIIEAPFRFRAWWFPQWTHQTLMRADVAEKLPQDQQFAVKLKIMEQSQKVLTADLAKKERESDKKN